MQIAGLTGPRNIETWVGGRPCILHLGGRWGGGILHPEPRITRVEYRQNANS
jgi:hypothetical protein